jgi:hypothetical protein
MLEALIPLFSTIFGSVGAMMKGHQERKMKALELEYSIKHRERDLEELKIESERAQKIAATEAETAREVSTDKALQASYTAFAPMFKGAQEWWLKLVDAFTALMRPVITLYLLGVTTYMAYCVNEVVHGLTALQPNELVGLYKTYHVSDQLDHDDGRLVVRFAPDARHQGVIYVAFRCG